MTMILELHIIQNFAPANLNRNDTGSPKDCVFGGARRARISSQCFKRAMRDYFRRNFSQQNNLAERTSRLVDQIRLHLVERNRDEAQATQAVMAALSGIGLKMKDDAKTQYLLFLGRDEIKAIASVCDENFDSLLAVSPATIEGASARESKKAAKVSVPADITKAIKKVLDGGKAADLALFGRMLADLPEQNREASAQVAHAISTHRVGLEFDFFTAVDDLRPEDTAGSDHLGTVEFNSACFYRYANLDVSKLLSNLGQDVELTRATVDAFVRASINAIPTGKQNSFATHEKPNFVLAVVRNAAFSSLANSFERPVADREWNADAKEFHEGLVRNSIEKFASHWDSVTSVYGDDAVAKVCITTSKANLGSLRDHQVANFETLIGDSLNAIFA